MSAFPDVKPFPGEIRQAVAAIGHNRPPIDVEARHEFDRALDEIRPGLVSRIDDLIASADRCAVVDNDTLGRAGELVKQIRAAAKAVDDAHAAAKAPYLQAGRVVDDAKKSLRGPLDDAKAQVERKQNIYQNEQRAIREAELRRQREAEEARRREELARIEAERAANPQADATPVEELPPPPPPVIEPEREIVRGDYGAAVSTKKEWKGRVTDYEVAFMAVSENEKVREAIDKAIQGMVRGGARKIEGVHIWAEEKVSNR